MGSVSASSAQLKDIGGGNCADGMPDIGSMARGCVAMVVCSDSLCKLLVSVWVQTLVVGMGSGLVWMLESSKTRVGGKQC
jgi:hypothetical protein